VKEIERKFLVKKDEFQRIKSSLFCFVIRQGYVVSNEDGVVRVRSKFGQNYLCVKGKNIGITRDEYEIAVPELVGKDLFGLCGTVIEKRRYRYPIIPSGKEWEIDEFLDKELDGLILAEIELSSEDEKFEIPYFIGDEVSDNPEYYSSSIVKKLESERYKKYRTDLSKCPGCGGPADNGHDRCDPPSPYYCTKCMREHELDA